MEFTLALEFTFSSQPKKYLREFVLKQVIENWRK